MFATLLNNAIGPAGSSLVAEVLNYSTVDLRGKTPVIQVFSDGTNRPSREGFGSDSYFTTEVRLRVAVFVSLPSSTDEAAGYTHLMAEDKLDLIDRSIADVVIANGKIASWMTLRYEPGFSEPRDVLLPGNFSYIMEEFRLVAKLR
jgi:hypothetical protein